MINYKIKYKLLNDDKNYMMFLKTHAKDTLNIVNIIIHILNNENKQLKEIKSIGSL